MATKQELFELKKKVERDVIVFKTLIDSVNRGNDLTEEESKKLDDIKTNIGNLVIQNKTLTALPATTNAAITKILALGDYSYENVFSYTPIVDSNKHLLSTKRFNSLHTISKMLEYKHENVKSNMAVGIPSQTFGIVDDLSNYTGQPTLKIQNLSNVLLPENNIIPIYDIVIEKKHIVSFNFKLNRFPSKILQSHNNIKQITTRRTDLITFEYGDSRLEFGAMAPYAQWRSQKTDGIVEKYKGSYNQFSIAANIVGHKGGSTSFYTDYKFELGKEYQVKLELVKTGNYGNNEFGTKDEYNIYLFVNNILENISVVKCKIWGQKGNFYKRNKENMKKSYGRMFIASQPNFLPYFVNPSDKKTYDSEVNVKYGTENKEVLGDFKFNQLLYIKTPPYHISNDEIITGRSFKTLGNNRLYKINSGVDVGTIEIYVGKNSNSKHEAVSVPKNTE